MPGMHRFDTRMAASAFVDGPAQRVIRTAGAVDAHDDSHSEANATVARSEALMTEPFSRPTSTALAVCSAILGLIEHE